ncbi:60 kDa chaperonin [Labeo rohita]|uniref:60 kDa chaperonin n=1 Tax=Labeo rohita TaxID=84645 RepID=A0ABQ8L762_LABRO|nr:60 kDa chaperonin [Labeo rohita]
MSMMEGDSVTLYSDVTKQQHDKMLWYFNNTLIVLISGEPSKSCVYYGEGWMFRDRLKVDYATGSLTIKNIRPKHSGRYEANFIQNKSSGTSQSLNQTSKCDGTKIIRKMVNISNTIKTFSVSVTAHLSGPDKISKKSYLMGKVKECEKRLSLNLIAGICAGVGVVLLMAAAVVEDIKKNKSKPLLKVPV